MAAEMSTKPAKLKKRIMNSVANSLPPSEHAMKQRPRGNSDSRIASRAPMQARTDGRDDLSSSAPQGQFFHGQQAATPAEPYYEKPRNMSRDEWIVTCQQEMRQRDRAIAALREENKQLKTAIAGMDKDRREQQAAREAEVSKLQKSIFQNIAETRWQPIDDATVSREFDLLQSKISQFAKMYAIAGFQGAKSWSPDELEHFTEVLRGEGIADFPSQSDLLDLMDLAYGPRLCLNALLSSTVYRECFQNPFIFLGHHLRAHLDGEDNISLSEQKSLADMLLDLYKRAHFTCEREANIWRSDTLRMFRLMMESDTEHGADENQLIEKCVAEACQQMVHDLEQSPVRLLVQQMESPTKEAYLRALSTILREAARLAVSLWSQRPGIRCGWLGALPQEHFQVESTMLQAHPIHKLEDSSDRQLDGRPVIMVVRPVIQRMGTHEGESYDQERTWAKAVVLVETGNRNMG